MTQSARRLFTAGWQTSAVLSALQAGLGHGAYERQTRWRAGSSLTHVKREKSTPRNVEIKARIDEYDELEAKVASIASEDSVVIKQDDTFFPCKSGRLKLRTFSEGDGELIFYRRADAHGPKESSYMRSPTTAPATLRESLLLAYGQVGRVQKVRTLYMVGRTRVHLDKIQHLGDFVELEVVLTEKESEEEGRSEADSLMEKLDIEKSQLVDGAYVDLLSQVDT